MVNWMEGLIKSMGFFSKIQTLLLLILCQEQYMEMVTNQTWIHRTIKFLLLVVMVKAMIQIILMVIPSFPYGVQILFQFELVQLWRISLTSWKR